ncbi:WG containing repeat-containing protein [Flavobacterium gillisiae]|uniref:WG containing repeat-containing protein n=1 Tax=Flavobacterium gillisiae TaxID=150146 RepID=A0A1H4C788_9FLAO|nr:WG repeat-containing protein [Flavobacterium gillisiae]SEA56305.1 WG containing repeat-containing protein [Flavobacterium gillisiae]
MEEKLKKLNELAELQKSGTITQEEFDTLKYELLNPIANFIEEPKLEKTDKLLDLEVIKTDEFQNIKSKNFISRPKEKRNISYKTVGFSLLGVGVLITLFFIFISRNKTLVPFLKANGKYIFVDSLTMKPQNNDEYDNLDFYSDGLARFERNNATGYIDNSGAIAFTIPKEFYSHNFSNEVAILSRLGGQEYYLINKEGIIVSKNYKDIDGFSKDNNLSVVKNEVDSDEKFGFIDNTGKEIVPLIYDFANSFSENLAAVGVGKTVIRVDDGLRIFKGKYGFIDRTGKVVIPMIYDEVGYFSEGLVRVKLNGKFGYVNKEGKIVIPLEYFDCSDFSDGLARVWQEKYGKTGYIDHSGKQVMGFNFSGARDFLDGLAVIQLGENKWGFIDKTESIISSTKFDAVGSFFSGGLATVGLGDCCDRIGELMAAKYGFIDKSGEVVIPIKYSSAYGFYPNGFAIVAMEGNIEDGQSFYIDKKGREYREK